MADSIPLSQLCLRQESNKGVMYITKRPKKFFFADF
jgi:hypothetical protein